MRITIELFFQVFNTILLIAIPVCIYMLVKKSRISKTSVEKRLTEIEKRLDNIK